MGIKQFGMNKTAAFQMKFMEIKSEDGKIKIKGFASTPDIDRYDDIVNPTAFANAMKTYMANPVVLLGHDQNKVIGKVIEYDLSGKGLEVTVELSNDIDNCFHNINEKNLRGFSIGYIVKGATYREENNREIREINDLDLIEISVVATPANPSSLFTLTKSLRLLFAESELKMTEEETEAEKAPEQKEQTTPETTEEINEDPKPTGEEAPEGETPETPQADAPVEGKTDIVEGDEKADEVQKGITADEAKSLIDEAVKEAVGAIMTRLDTAESKNTELLQDLKKINDLYTELKTQHKNLESEILNIDVSKGQILNKKSIVITDRMAIQTLGM